jgi:hypothetical protein
LGDNTEFPPKKIILFEKELPGPQQAEGFFRLREKIDKYEVKNVTVNEIANQIASLIKQITGKGDTVKIKEVSWPSEKAKDLVEKSNVNLKKIYLIARYEPEKIMELEYALWLEIQCSNKLKDELSMPFSFDELYLKIWQTTDKKILKDMAIISG